MPAVGEEIYAGTAGRTTALGYTSNNVRQHFTGYEHDTESGLDYAHARYYANKQGRFTSGDPLMSSAKPTDPQSWNRYTYCLNNPVALTDPTGMEAPRGPDARFMAGFRGASGSGDMQVFEGTQYTNGEVPGGYAEVVAYGIFGSQIASSTDLRSEWLFGQHIEA